MLVWTCSAAEVKRQVAEQMRRTQQSRSGFAYLTAEGPVLCARLELACQAMLLPGWLSLIIVGDRASDPITNLVPRADNEV